VSRAVPAVQGAPSAPTETPRPGGDRALGVGRIREAAMAQDPLNAGRVANGEGSRRNKGGTRGH
jgi:hypothetical protein